jgi:hypothetical protein
MPPEKKPQFTATIMLYELHEQGRHCMRFKATTGNHRKHVTDEFLMRSGISGSLNIQCGAPWEAASAKNNIRGVSRSVPGAMKWFLHPE